MDFETSTSGKAQRVIVIVFKYKVEALKYFWLIVYFFLINIGSEVFWKSKSEVVVIDTSLCKNKKICELLSTYTTTASGWAVVCWERPYNKDTVNSSFLVFYQSINLFEPWRHSWV